MKRPSIEYRFPTMKEHMGCGEGRELRDGEAGKYELGVVTGETRMGNRVNPTGTKRLS